MRNDQAVGNPQAGLTDGRLWWEQTSDHWDIPFPMDMILICGFAPISERDDALAAREQLWAIREGLVDA